MNIPPVATFDERAPAERLRTQLCHAGVAAVIQDESKVERFWFMSEQLAAIHVKVPETDYLKARELLAEWEKTTDLLEASVRCPECHSSRIEFPQISRKSLVPAVGQTLLMLIRVLPRKYYCADCHCTWAKTSTPVPELDALNWPVNSRFWHPKVARRLEK